LTNLGVNTSNRITLAGFTYDAAGNETADVTNTYVWNAESEIKTGGGVNLRAVRHGPERQVPGDPSIRGSPWNFHDSNVWRRRTGVRNGS
jgi:hypothetical protein